MKLSKDKISSHEFWTDERCFITECLNSDEVKDFSLAIARVEPSVTTQPVSYTHLTLPTKA